MPQNIILGQDEKVIKVVKPHWFYFAPFALYLVLLLIMIGLGWSFLAHFPVMFLIAFLMIVLVIYAAYFAYTRTVFILTDKRLINIETAGILNRNINILEYANIQSLDVEQAGLENSFGFGKIKIQVAGGEASLKIINTIPNPNELLRIILDLKSGTYSGAADQTGLDLDQVTRINPTFGLVLLLVIILVAVFATAKVMKKYEASQISPTTATSNNII